MHFENSFEVHNILEHYRDEFTAREVTNIVEVSILNVAFVTQSENDQQWCYRKNEDLYRDSECGCNSSSCFRCTAILLRMGNKSIAGSDDVKMDVYMYNSNHVDLYTYSNPAQFNH